MVNMAHEFLFDAHNLQGNNAKYYINLILADTIVTPSATLLPLSVFFVQL